MGGEAGLYYALNPDCMMCGYRGMPYLLYHRRVGTFSAISKADAELLMRCDGAADMPPSPALERLCACRILNSAPEPLSIDDAQRYVYYDNRFFRTATWAVTAGCNLNCRHCFVAKDANRAADRFSLEEARKLIGEMKACGIREVHLTGGEPLTHPEIDEIIAELSRQDLKIARMVTNGLLIDDAFLRRLRTLGQDPLFPRVAPECPGHRAKDAGPDRPHTGRGLRCLRADEPLSRKCGCGLGHDPVFREAGHPAHAAHAHQ